MGRNTTRASSDAAACSSIGESSRMHQQEGKDVFHRGWIPSMCQMKVINHMIVINLRKVTKESLTSEMVENHRRGNLNCFMAFLKSPSRMHWCILTRCPHGAITHRLKEPHLLCVSESVGAEHDVSGSLPHHAHAVPAHLPLVPAPVHVNLLPGPSQHHPADRSRAAQKHSQLSIWAFLSLNFQFSLPLYPNCFPIYYASDSTDFAFYPQLLPFYFRGWLSAERWLK